MPKVELVRNDAWKSAPAIITRAEGNNTYSLQPGGHLLVFDAKTGEHKYETTRTTCTCPAGEFNKICKHRKMLETLSEETA